MDWKATLVAMKKSGNFSWQLLKKSQKFLTWLEECQAKDLFISPVNGSIKFKMPDDVLNREAIFSMMIEKHASKLSALKYSKRTQMMRITW